MIVPEAFFHRRHGTVYLIRKTFNNCLFVNGVLPESALCHGTIRPQACANVTASHGITARPAKGLAVIFLLSGAELFAKLL